MKMEFVQELSCDRCTEQTCCTTLRDNSSSGYSDCYY